MPKIIVQTEIPGSDTALRTLSERLVADNLDSLHYTAQLIERITWAVADAEALESRTETAEVDAQPRAAAATISDRPRERRPMSAAISA